MILTDTFHGVLKSNKKELRPGVIGVVEGIFGVAEELNRNGRKYTRKLWEKVIADPEIQSKLKNRSIFGEADHPEGLYAGIARASHIVTGLDLREVDGKTVVYGTAELLDTPTGRILKTLFDAGCTVGISSRGSGSLLDDVNSSDKVVSLEDYIYGGHDFVAEPACPGSYPKLTTEVVDNIKKVVSENADRVLADKPYYSKLLEGFGVKEVIDKVLNEEVDNERKGAIVKAAQSAARNKELKGAADAYSNWVGDKEKDIQTEKNLFLSEYNKELAVVKSEQAKNKESGVKEGINNESLECLTKALNLIDGLNDSLTSEDKVNTINLMKEAETTIKDLKKRIKGLVKRKKMANEGIEDRYQFEISVLKGLLDQNRKALDESVSKMNILAQEKALLVKENRKTKKVRNIYIKENNALSLEMERFNKLLKESKTHYETIIDELNKDLDVLVEDIRSNETSNKDDVVNLQKQIELLKKENLDLSIKSVAMQYGISQNKIRKVIRENATYDEIVDIAKEFSSVINTKEALPTFEDLKENLVDVVVENSKEIKQATSISNNVSKMIRKMK